MPTILFICTGNICRSPMAGGLFRQKLAGAGLAGKWQVASAGTWTRDGYPAARKGQELLAEMGIDISRHRSRVVTANLLQAADLILTMEQGQKEALRVEFPEAAERVYLLSEIVGYGQDIQDPMGGTLLDFKDTLRDINQCLDDGFEKIIQLARS